MKLEGFRLPNLRRRKHRHLTHERLGRPLLTQLDAVVARARHSTPRRSIRRNLPPLAVRVLEKQDPIRPLRPRDCPRAVAIAHRSTEPSRPLRDHSVKRRRRARTLGWCPSRLRRASRPRQRRQKRRQPTELLRQLQPALLHRERPAEPRCRQHAQRDAHKSARAYRRPLPNLIAPNPSTTAGAAEAIGTSADVDAAAAAIPSASNGFFVAPTLSQHELLPRRE